MEGNNNKFEVIILAVIFNPKEKKILIGKRENDPIFPNLTWGFPGGRVIPGEDVDASLKKKIKLKTGYEIKNLGAIFSKTYIQKRDLLAVYFLTEIFEGEEKPGDDSTELKWISPKEIEDYFGKGKIHPKLKEYLLDLI